MNNKLTKREAWAILQAFDRTSLDALRDYALLRLVAAGDDPVKSWLELKWGELDWDYWAKHYPDIHKAIMEYLKESGRLDTIQSNHFIFIRHIPLGDGRRYKADVFKHISYSTINRHLKLYARWAGVDMRKAQFEQLRNLLPAFVETSSESDESEPESNK